MQRPFSVSTSNSAAVPLANGAPSVSAGPLRVSTVTGTPRSARVSTRSCLPSSGSQIRVQGAMQPRPPCQYSTRQVSSSGGSSWSGRACARQRTRGSSGAVRSRASSSPSAPASEAAYGTYAAGDSSSQVMTATMASTNSSSPMRPT